MSEINIRRILVVDDEPNIVSAIQRELNTPPFEDYDYVVETYTDPALALQRTREVTFDAVISDFRMPGMDGSEFLKQLTLIQPDCMRIVLSGQVDLDALVRLVNEGRIYRFIQKPWSAHFLKAALAQALDYSAVLLENRRLADIAAARGVAFALPVESAVEQILVVDDDMGVLNSLSRTLKRHSHVDDLVEAIRGEAQHGSAPAPAPRISIQASPSPQHALRLAGVMDFSCIIADFRMPEMDGVELLKRFAALQPDCTRILISGQLDRNELIMAVNAAHIFAFLDKPWTDFDLKATALLALSRHRMLQENRKLAELLN